MKQFAILLFGFTLGAMQNNFAIAASIDEAKQLSREAYQLANNGQYEESLPLWEEAIEHYKKKNLTKEVAEITIEIAHAKQSIGQGLSACTTLQKYLKAEPNLCIPAHGNVIIQPPQIGSSSEDAIIASNFAQIIKNFGLFEPAKLYADAAIKSAKQHNYSEVIPDLKIIDANIELFQLMFDRDQFVFREKIQLSDADTEIVISKFSKLFNAYQQQFQSPLRLESQLKWLTTFQELDKQATIFKSKQLDLYSQRLSNQYYGLLNGLSEIKNLKDFLPQEQLRLKLEIARLLHEADKKNSNPSHQKASYLWTTDLIESAQATDHKYFISSGYALLAQQYQLAQQFKSALQAYQVASSNSDLSLPQYQYQYKMAQLFEKLGDKQQAERYYDSAIALIEEAQWNMSPLDPSIKGQFQEVVRPIYDDYISFQLTKEKPNFSKGFDLRNRYIDQIIEVYLGCGEIKSLPVEALSSTDPQAAFISIFKVRQDYFTLVRSGDRYTWSKANAKDIDPVLFRLIGVFESDSIKSPISIVNRDYQLLYDRLLGPVAEEIEPEQTLLFTNLDPKLQQIPLSALHDGQSYLIERHPIATIGNIIYEPKKIDPEKLNVFFAGISGQPDSNVNLGPFQLPYILNEKDSVSPDKSILNQGFTKSNFFKNLNKNFQIVHVATHGQFGSKPEETFLLAWDGLLDLSDISQGINARSLDSPIELLILSACETANGDRLAALGIAGFSIRAGARSTLATLWQAIDASSPFLMERFYFYLRNGETKAGALQQAQIDMISEGYSLYSWANSVLVGSWL